MSLASTHVTSSYVEFFQTALSDTNGEVVAVNLNEEQLTALIDCIDSLSEPPTVRGLVTNSVAKWVRDDFLLASAVADGSGAGTLSLRTTETLLKNTLLVTEEAVIPIISTEDHVAGPVTDSDEFVGSAREKWDDEWNEVVEFSLRTPPRSEVYESLADEIGDEVAADFKAMLDSIDTTRDEKVFNEVGLSLLAAANNGIQLFEISRWGEDVGVASKATFSRTKNHLEDKGLIETEKIPIDVGRPRLRLLLSDELQGVDVDDLVEQARNVMSAASA